MAEGGTRRRVPTLEYALSGLMLGLTASGAIERDEWGYVITGTEGRALLETTMSGVFAVGDVRAGSVKRVASAVGEGSIAVRLVHDYLAGNS